MSRVLLSIIPLSNGALGAGTWPAAGAYAKDLAVLKKRLMVVQALLKEGVVLLFITVWRGGSGALLREMFANR